MNMKENLNFDVNLKEMEQIDKNTGISKDYVGELSTLITFYGFGGMKAIIDILKKNPINIKKYVDRYAGFKNVINDSNKENVKKLDLLVDKLNEIIKDPNSIDEKKFRETINKMYFLIYGNNEIKI